jgi:phospholipid transport system substrate-binding protein
MLTRRTTMITIGATALLAMPPTQVHRAWAQPGETAVAFIKSTSEQLVSIANGPGSPQEKRRRLQLVIDSTVDVDDIAHFCLGRFWRIATPDQQKEYMSLFHDLLLTEIAAHLGEYQGVRVNIGLARASSDTEIVITMVERPNNPATQVDWVVATNTGGPKIIDLLAEGTSMRLTHSADFTAYLARHQYNIHELVEGMRQRIAQSG